MARQCAERRPRGPEPVVGRRGLRRCRFGGRDRVRGDSRCGRAAAALVLVVLRFRAERARRRGPPRAVIGEGSRGLARAWEYGKSATENAATAETAEHRAGAAD